MTRPMPFDGQVARARRTGQSVGDGPHVVWRRAGCRERILSVFLRPSGWEVLGEDFREHPARWEKRVDADWVSLAEHFGGEGFITHLRSVKGIRQTMPLDVTEWPSSARFEVGCDHVTTEAHLDWLRDDCLKFRQTRRRVTRTVPQEEVT